MSFRLVPKSVTLNDLERRNGRYFALFQRIWVASGRTAKKFTFAISSRCIIGNGLVHYSIDYCKYKGQQVFCTGNVTLELIVFKTFISQEVSCMFC